MVVYNKAMAGKLIRRLPKEQFIARNKKIIEYAALHTELSFRQLGEIFGLNQMTIHRIVGPRPNLKRHFCDKCGHTIPAPLPEPGDVPISIEGDSALAQIAD